MPLNVGQAGIVYRKLVYPLWCWKDGMSPFRYLREFEVTQYYDEDKIREYQWLKMKQLLRHAYDKCPYYRETWRKVGIEPGDIKTLEDVFKIPFLTKADIQQNLHSMRRNDIPVAELVKNQTGGSTGEPLVFYLDKERIKSRLASTIRHDRWAGKDIGTFHASIWGHASDNRTASETLWENVKREHIYRYMILDTSSLTEKKMEGFLDALRRRNPEIYVAYANSVYLLAELAKHKGIRDLPRPRSIITTAEYLEADRRRMIEEVFGCRVFDRYGCREISVLASECGRHEGLHVNAECVYLEILKDGKPARDGETGEVVVTDLMNYGMPLIRYKINDVASFLGGRCECRRGLPRIAMRGGRVTDFITTPDGRMVSGAALTIFLVANTPGARQVQLLQDEKNKVKVRIVKGAGYTDESSRYIIGTSKRFFGEGMDIEIEFRDEIPMTVSGKNLFCISRINPFSTNT